MAKYKLGDIAPIQQGSVPESESYWLLNLDMVESNTGHIYERLYVPFDKIGTSTIAFDTNNVLYSKLRPYLNKVVIPDCPGYATSEMLPLKPNKNYITREYLTYFLRSPKFVAYINEKTSGAKMPRANSSDLKSVEIECPTLENQRHITSEFDRIISIVRLRQQQLQKLDELVKARFIELFGDSEFNTMQWPTKKLSELCAVSSSKRIYQNEQSTEGVPFLRISDLNERIDNVKNAPELFIPINKYNELKENGLVPTEGDILVTSRGTLGRCYIVRPEDEFYFQDGMISWLSDLNSQITSVYLSQLFAMSGIQKQIASLQAGSTVAYLSITMLKKLNIMLPPLDRQEQYATFVEQTDKSKVAVQKALDEAQLLFDSLMQKYFG